MSIWQYWFNILVNIWIWLKVVVNYECRLNECGKLWLNHYYDLIKILKITSRILKCDDGSIGFFIIGNIFHISSSTPSWVFEKVSDEIFCNVCWQRGHFYTTDGFRCFLCYKQKCKIPIKKNIKMEFPGKMQIVSQFSTSLGTFCAVA